MILEIVKWNIKPNLEERFQEAFTDAQKYLIKSKGYQSHKLLKCIEIKNQYNLLVYWSTLENHTIDFQQSNEYQKYKALMSQYLEEGTILQHYQIIDIS